MLMFLITPLQTKLHAKNSPQIGLKRFMQSARKLAGASLTKIPRNHTVLAKDYSTKILIGRAHKNTQIADESEKMEVHNKNNKLVPLEKEEGHWKGYNPKTRKITHTFTSSKEFPKGCPTHCLDPNEQLNGAQKAQYVVENEVETHVPSYAFVVDKELTRHFHRKYLHKPDVRAYFNKKTKGKRVPRLDFNDDANKY